MLPKTYLISGDKINQNNGFYVESIIYLLLATGDSDTCTYYCEFHIILIYTSARDQS